MLEAVKQDAPNVMKKIDSALLGIKRIILEAVKQEGGLIRVASSDLKSDIDIVTAACSQDPNSIKFAEGDAKSDRDLFKTILQGNGMLIEFADGDLRADKELAEVALRSTDGKAFDLISE